jgi:hypothetical protein
MRRFPDFLKAYAAYSDDKFVPPQFNVWTGLSIIAGALERKVYLPWSDTYAFYPNIYVLLVSKPGVGKSVALNNGVKLLTDVSRKSGTLNIMPSQVTEAKFIELMGHGRSFMHKWVEEKVDDVTGVKQLTPRELTIFQNSGYYFASEASNSLRNIFGEFIACLTDFYDCPEHWERATKKDGKRIQLRNVCMNILAGSTFDYLGKLITDDNIQGGFASRVIYVVHSEKLVRRQEFQNGLSAADHKVRAEYRAALLDDLMTINKLTGPMVATPEFSAAWEKWYPEFEEKRQSYASEKLQSIAARTNTNCLKVSILLSAAESDDRILRLHHWEQARDLVEGVNAQIPSIFQEAKAKQGPRGAADALTAFILTKVRQGGISREGIVNSAVAAGFSARHVEDVLNALHKDGALAVGSVVGGAAGGANFVLSGNSNKYL